MISGKWISKIDICGTNLNVAAGQPLPDAWQNITKIKYLRQHYPEDTFYFHNTKNPNENIGGSIHKEFETIKAEIAELKTILLEMQNKSAPKNGRK